MADPTGSTERIDVRSDMGKGDDGVWAYWMAQEKVAEKAERSWIYRGRKVVKRYRDDRGDTDGYSGGIHKFNILWSNVQTLKPALYARTPKPDVQRRFLDQDDTGRLASLLLERCLSYSIDAFDFDAVMEAVVEDRLLPGRGAARVMYIPHYGDEIPSEDDAAEDSDGDANPEFEQTEAEGADVANPGDEVEENPKVPAKPLREVVYEEVIALYVFWEDYREGPARTWKEVPWVRYAAYMTKAELIERFGKKLAAKINLDFTPKTESRDDKEDPPPDIYKKARIFEYWDKTKKQAVWIAPGTPDLVLDTVDDPLELPDFFPGPDPLLATTTNDKRIPVPDYIEYQDQAHELDTLTMRIDRLTRALKISGVYPGANKQVLQQLIDEGTENRLIPVEDWAGFADKGGLTQIIQFMPIKEIAETLVNLYQARDATKALLYEITGIGDILRGETDPNETMGAQQLKANFSTRRLVPQQRKVARFARDLIRIMAAVIAGQFSKETVSAITGYPQLQPVPELPSAPPQFMPPSPMQPGIPGVMPAPAQQPMPAPQSGMAPMAGVAVGAPAPAPMPQPKPNPAYQQWVQLSQQVQQIKAQNDQKQKQFDDAFGVIEKDGVKGFRLDIETDSTIAPDEQAEQDSRVLFLKEMVPLLDTVVPVAQGNPPLASLSKEMVLFAARGFRVARSLEEAFEKAFDALATMPPKPDKNAPKAQQGQSPQEIALDQQRVQAEMKGDALQAQADLAETQSRTKIEQLKATVEMAKLKIEQGKAYLEAQEIKASIELKRANAVGAMVKAGVDQRGQLLSELEAVIGTLDSGQDNDSAQEAA